MPDSYVKKKVTKIDKILKLIDCVLFHKILVNLYIYTGMIKNIKMTQMAVLNIK